MIIHTPTNIPCFPLCKYCTNPITERGLKTKRGQYYYLDCYEQHWQDIKTLVQESLSVPRLIKVIINDA